MRIGSLLACVALCCAAAGGHAPDRPDTVVFRDACDGSAGAALPGGLFVDANDETNLLRVYRPTGGRPVAARSMSAFLKMGHKTEADIEAAATLRQRDGDVTYWMTSHARDSRGGERPERARLFATRWNGATLVPVGRPRADLRRALLAAPGLGLGAVGGKAPEDGGINVEGLADGGVFGGAGDLLIGFRSPLIGPERRALIVPLADAAGLVGAHAPVRFGAPVLLDLGGRGIRSLERIGDGYVIAAGPASGDGSFALFRWSGRAGDVPVEVPAPIAGLVVEGLIPLADGRLLLLSDDGSPLCKNAPRAGKRFRGRVVAVR